MEKKIYPSVEELTKVNCVVRCVEDGCTSVFTSESNLMLHLAKTHKKEYLLKTDNVVKQYHCPDLTCVYNTSKFFKKLKQLKQHYLKVHGLKNFICDLCSKGFATLAAKNNHSEYCGVQFQCIDCGVSYPCYETLLTHARRKKHKILEKTRYKPKSKEKSAKKSSSLTDVQNRKKNQFILPKGSVSLQFITIDPNRVMYDKSNQADLDEEEQVSSASKNNFNHTSSQTQGYLLQKMQSSAETQTIGDYVMKKLSTDFGSSSDESLNRKSIKTQTKPVSSTTKSCNTSFNLDDYDFMCDIKVERNSSSTQTVTTVPAELIYSTSMEPPKDLNFDMVDPLDTDNYFNTNSETQTDFIFENDLMSPDYYSNMYTQTCDDILLNELGFNNTHTQTVFDDMLRSVESQTMMSQGLRPLMTCRDMAHMETQTDIEFKQILEEINA